MNRRRLVRVPASSANLGPGFDVLAAALSLTLEVEVIESGSFSIETDLDVPTDKSNLIVKAFETLHSADDFTFLVTTDIPLTGGLGSSASAILAGVAAADHIFELGTDLLAQAAAIEGHKDNLAASFYGGFVACGNDHIARIEPPAGIEGIVAIPPADHSVPTAQARAALPPEVPISDAVTTAAQTSFVTLGLERGDWDLLSRGLTDVMHQPRRAHLFPESMALVERARGLGALGATISGAGPTVLVWSTWESTGNVLDAVKGAVGPGWDVRRVTFAQHGLDIKV
ncbi:MAG TPA: homoserine kinase [Solirubrobacterales bacterium]|jgi:homoserine kinase|nr:homoserine kinase [Solirubrobacterales bacterium]